MSTLFEQSETKAGQLRPYQQDVAVRGRLQMAKGYRRGIIQGETGSGKTYVIAHLAQLAVAKGKRVLILADRRRLVRQMGGTLSVFGVRYGVIMAEESGRLHEDCVVASRDTLAAWNRYGRDPIPFDLILIDECFPAGTLIDGRPIESIRVGDEVTCFDPATKGVTRRRVTHTFKRPAPETMVSISAAGRRLLTTPNHPVLTTRGWVNACDIEVGDIVYGLFSDVYRAEGAVSREVQPRGEEAVLLARMLRGMEDTASAGDVCGVRCGIHGGEEGSSLAGEGGTAGVLLDSLHEGVLRPSVGGEPGCDESEVRFGPHEGEQSDVAAGGPGEGFRVDAADGTQADNSRRQRTRSYRAREIAFRVHGALPGRGADGRAGARLPDELQARFGGPGREAGNRDRRRQSQVAEGEGGGRPQRGVLERARVDSVTVLQRGSSGGPGALCPDGQVYNLEVEGFHTYVADGFAVHNCHKAMGEVYQSLLALYPNTYVIGFTATPARGDGKALGSFFHWIECTVPASQLIREGWLIKPEVYAPLELATQRKKGATTKGLAGDPVQHWKRHAEGLPTIAFAGNVGESIALRDRFNEAGIPAEHVDGTDEDGSREAKYERLQNGRTLVLCSVDLLIEGVDFPGVSAAILWRKFGSLVQYRQGCGRIMRPAKGKTRAVVLDHAGAAGVHGLPGDDVEWSLDENSTVDGRRKKAVEEGRQDVVVVCHACGLAFSGEPQCPACGWKPKHKSKPSAPKQIHEARDEVLSRYEGDAANHVNSEARQRHWASCLYIAAARKAPLGAAAAMFTKKFGVPPWTCGVKPLPGGRGDWKRPVVEVFPQFDKGAANAQR